MNLTINELNINIQDGFVTIVSIVLIIGLITTYLKKSPAK